MKNIYGTVTFVAGIAMMIAAVAIVMLGQSPCDNTNRFNSGMKTDACIPMDKATAQALYNNHKTFRLPANSTLPLPQGAWIGKELIDQLFTDNSNNGLYIILGLDNSGSTPKVCFMLSSYKQDFRTTVPVTSAKPYFRLDAMCPALCDGLTP